MVTISRNALHHHLKLATAVAHSNLECLLAKRGYFDSLEQYTGYLQRFLAFQDEAETALDAAMAALVIPDWRDRRRAHLARADLAALNAKESRFPCSAGRLPHIAGSEQVLGIAYVLESTTLGGAYLLKQLAPLGITASHGGSYLASYGSDRGKMWQRYLFTLEEAHLRRVRVESIAAAALATFAAACHYLTEGEQSGSASNARAFSMTA